MGKYLWLFLFYTFSRWSRVLDPLMNTSYCQYLSEESWFCEGYFVLVWTFVFWIFFWPDLISCQAWIPYSIIFSSLRNGFVSHHIHTRCLIMSSLFTFSWPVIKLNSKVYIYKMLLNLHVIIFFINIVGNSHNYQRLSKNCYFLRWFFCWCHSFNVLISKKWSINVRPCQI